MATENNKLSDYDKSKVPDASGMRFAILVSEWNDQITSNLLSGAKATLEEHGATEIDITWVPGSFELPLAAQIAIENSNINAAICLGSVIRGETAHFDFVCQSCSQGIMDVSLKTGKPVVFGVLTDDNLQQSIDRSGGRLGNKGTEAAVTAIKMAAINQKSNSSWGFRD